MELTKIIITAMKEEAEIIIKRFDLHEIDNKHNVTVFEGKRISNNGNEKIILVLSGIGKIQAAIATTYILENYKPDKIVNIGIAGNLNSEEVKIGDVFLPNTFIQHDMYLPFEGEHLDYAKKPIFIEYAIGKSYDLKKFNLILSGVCLTGDQFIDNEEKVSELKNTYGADVCEMEAFAILSVAKQYGVLDKCVVIKAISDGANNEAIDAHMNNLDFAVGNSVDILELVL
ncbi:MAG: 5'-methylthioadenosine/S-adenosylhomocysteine nucleosidase [Candidatus Gracilibacteria bacterium]